MPWSSWRHSIAGSSGRSRRKRSWAGQTALCAGLHQRPASIVWQLASSPKSSGSLPGNCGHTRGPSMAKKTYEISSAVWGKEAAGYLKFPNSGFKFTFCWEMILGHDRRRKRSGKINMAQIIYDNQQRSAAMRLNIVPLHSLMEVIIFFLCFSCSKAANEAFYLNIHSLDTPHSVFYFFNLLFTLFLLLSLL